ncbi:MAG TPA: M20/M25/M40 family metallo-hydrolase [Ferruginibacter sp.]|nr:M20/M25/M40 family metallo-hydrolase [Ferruginibacter sp.]HMP20972.1 M20/M25/M40 family metallo-hydrolase [Ferruginibacter sp.]
MKKIFFLICSIGLLSTATAQSPKKLIKEKEVKRIEKTLASDDMQGRKTFTPGIARASAFIEGEFAAAGLQFFNKETSYRQQFHLYSSIVATSSLSIDGKKIPDSMLAVFSYQPQVSFTEKSDIEVVKISKGDKIGPKFYEYYQSKKNLLVLVDASFDNRRGRIRRMDKLSAEPGNNTVIFVFGVNDATQFSIEVTNQVEKKWLNNVVGVLPGKSRPDEYVIFSAHYDHLGIDPAAGSTPDSIYNGANDDAAGTTAVIMLAKYFAKLNNNERTLIFTAFTAEEIGGYGSQYFSKQLEPEKVVAMFNIEMIGTPSKWGNQSAYITGFDKTDMGSILQKNVEGTGFNFYADPYPEQQLFYRSDNATLARLGVPAHTISTSKMDSEPNYHKLSDEIKFIDFKNMTQVIRAIALSASSIISGVDTPSRVDSGQLQPKGK